MSNKMAFLKAARISAGYPTQGAAAQRVGYEPGSIGRHERGEIVPTPEAMGVYAQAYDAPEILLEYCRACCPIGCKMLRPAQVSADLSLLVTQLNNRIRKLPAAAERLSDIADDNEVDASERQDFERISEQICELRHLIDDFERYALRAFKKPACSGADRSARAVPTKGRDTLYSQYSGLAGVRQ